MRYELKVVSSNTKMELLFIRTESLEHFHEISLAVSDLFTLIHKQIIELPTTYRILTIAEESQ